MRATKTILVVAVSVGTLLLAGDWWVKRNLRRTDFGPLAELFKARVAGVLVSPAWTAADTKESAQLFDTYVNASQVALAVTKTMAREALPKTSETLRGLDPRFRFDAWGNPFCFASNRQRLAVLSAGRRTTRFSDCNEIEVDMSEVFRLPAGRLFTYPSGALVLLIDREELR